MLKSALRPQGYEQVAGGSLSDPIVATGTSAELARVALARYLHQMYGLIGLGDGRSPDVLDEVLSLAESSFGAIIVERVPDQRSPCRASLPRVAAYAVGAVPAR